MLDSDIKDSITSVREKYKFLTALVVEDEKGNQDVRVGIVQNETQKVIHFFDIEKIRDETLRTRFLEYGDQWWWEASQRLPIDAFIGPEFSVFRELALVGYPKKSITEHIGPTLNLNDLYGKRIKKKKIDILSRG